MSRSRVRSFGSWVLVGSFALAGCFQNEAAPDDGGTDEGQGEHKPRTDGGGGEGGEGGSGAGSCRATEIQAGGVDKVDLLFVVDDSGSMREEQALLSAQFPRLVRVLTSGDLDDDGQADFPPARDLHLGVVSTDMGLAGISGLPNCEGLGDDGVLQSQGMVGMAGCQASYPPFVSYNAELGNAEQVANDFACVASLGTEGCGFEQQLEAALKALWPAEDRGGNGAMDPGGMVMTPNRISFLADPDTGAGTTGHGDGANLGFLRNDPSTGLSVVAVIVVSDEEDCSSRDTSHFTPPNQLDPNDPLASQNINLRCFLNPENLYSVQRYVDGLKALRPDAEQLVVFGAIVGVPADLVDEDARARVDFADDAQRNSHYDAVLADARMQEVIDPARPAGQENLTPSCELDRDGDGAAESRAYPPRRFVEVVRGFGQSGTLQSICQNDFAKPMDAIVERIAAQLGEPCLPRPLVRGSDGEVSCELIWELPLPGTAPPGSPTRCTELPFLEADGMGADGRERCRVRQLAVEDGAQPAGEGWFYDDFSEDVRTSCLGGAAQRIAFTASAKPPSGVRVQLDCCDD